MAAVTVTRSQLSVARPPLPSDLTRRQASPSASAFRHPSSIPLIVTSLRSQLGPNRARRECRAGALELNWSPLDEDGEARNDTFLKNFLPRPLSSAYLSAWTPKEARLRVAYEGFKGAYSEAAALEAYPDCEPVPCAEFDTAFQAVEGWLVDRAVLPIENSLNGSIHRNYDLLLRHKLHIVGEVNLDVQHCLLANHGVKLEDLNRVLSHPLAFDQCERTLKTLGFSERETRYDTAGAAKEIAELQLKDTGAVASFAAASIYNLNILEENVQDEGYNVTRFFMLAREPIIPRTDRPCKTSIVFTLPDEIGILVSALGFFALRNINLTKIESRPLLMQRSRASDYRSDGSPRRFDYLFYLDFEASMADEVAQNALRQLNEFATFVRVLGSYPADKR